MQAQSERFADERPEVFRQLGVKQCVERPGTGRWVGFLTMTPQSAQFCLMRNASNRTPSPGEVRKYVDDAVAQDWYEDASMLVFEGDRLKDGQGRCQTVLESGLTELFVVHYRPEDQPAMYDLQRLRTVPDHLEIGVGDTFEGVEKHRLGPVAPALAINCRWMHGSFEHYRALSRLGATKLLKTYPGMAAWAARVRYDWYRENSCAIPAAAMAGFLECYRINTLAADHYAESVCTGVELGLDAPARRVRKLLVEAITRPAKRASVPRLANIVMYGFDAYRENREVQRIMVDPEHFEFPRGAQP